MPGSRRAAALLRAAGRGRSGAAVVRAGMGAGLQAAGQARSAAGEMVRVRRDPAVAALRRQAAARRRTQGWGLGTGLGVAGTAGAVTALLTHPVTAMAVFYLVLALVVLVYCGTGAVRAVRDLRQRSRVVAALPPPQPARRPVDRSLSAAVDQLGHYSDTLRHTIAGVGLVEDAMTLDLRAEVIRAADAAEVRLRSLAGELTALLRVDRSTATIASPALSAQLMAGIEQYGELVDAAAVSAHASRTTMAAAPSADPAVTEMTERLRALASGLQVLSGR